MEDVINILDSLGDAILIHRDGTVVYINQAYSELVGDPDPTTTLNYLLGKKNNYFHLIHPDDKGLVMHYTEQRELGNDDIPTTYSFRLVTPLGGERLVECNTSQIHWGQLPANMVKYTDVSHRLQNTRSETMLTSMFEESLNAIPCIVCITDVTSGKIIYINEFTRKFFNYDHSEIIGRTTAELDIWVNIEDRETLVKKLQANEVVKDFRAEQRDSEGKIYPMSINVTLLRNQPTPLMFFTSFDRTDEHHYREELKEINANLDFLARHDSLTGLYNRREGTENISREIASFRRYKKPVVILLMDIDHFKRVNDRFGHDGGDAVLVEVTTRIMQSIREVDICCRWGGEEFLVILPSTNYEGGKEIAERIRNTVASLPIELPNNDSIAITISIGCASMTSELVSGEAFVKVADELLYLAKSQGRNQVSSTQ